MFALYLKYLMGFGDVTVVCREESSELSIPAGSLAEIYGGIYQVL